MKRLFSTSLLFLLITFANAQVRLINIELKHAAAGQEQIVCTFSGPPDYYYYMKGSPYSLVIVVQGTLKPRQYYLGGRFVKAVESRIVDPRENHLCVKLQNNPDIAVTTQGNKLQIDLKAKNSEPVATTTPVAPSENNNVELPTLRMPMQDFGNLHIRRIVIDPGHGGWDTGAAYGRAVEKNIVLDIAVKLEELIKKNTNLEVYLTRRGDYYLPLRERTLIANQYNADLFISIHANASTNKKRKGVETYYCSEKASDKMAARIAATENAIAEKENAKILAQNHIDIEQILFKVERKLYWQDSRKIAGTLQTTLCNHFFGNKHDVRSANFSVLRNAKMPAVLVEVGYISNVGERHELLREKRHWEIAKIIVITLIEYEKQK